MEKSGLFSTCLVVLSAFTAAPPAVAGTLYVDASATTGANDGSSWANAFQGPAGVRLALAGAVSGDQIWVADGTYLPTLTGVRTRSLDLKSGVKLYGGFAGGETSLSQSNPSVNVAVLSGDLAGDDAGANYADNSLHVLKASAVQGGASLDGFRIEGGNADAGPGGGGLLLVNNSCVGVRRCVFTDNRCTSSGGAVSIQGSGNGCPSFEDCAFEGNFAGISGGAVHVVNAGETVSFTRCIFSGNAAPEGSAVYLQLSFGTFFRECLVYGNTATGSNGGAIRAVTETDVYVLGSTVVANSSTTAPVAGVSGGVAVLIRNSIVYFNSGPGGAQGSGNQIGGGSPAQGDHSCVQGGLGGSGMISADPLFIDAAGGNFRLTPSSPCVDRGNNTHAGAWADALDLDRTPRLQDVTSTLDTGSGTAPIVDMGAYESPGGLYEGFCPGDGSVSTACPCGNFGQEGRGCANSTYWPGALLAAAGAASPDTVRLTASWMGAGVLCIFLQGNIPISSGVAFGDGVRCVGGALKRIGSMSASPSGVASYPGSGNLSISARSALLGDPIQAGTERWYQTWYRDNSASFCPTPPGGVSNVTGGVIVSW